MSTSTTISSSSSSSSTSSSTVTSSIANNKNEWSIKASDVAQRANNPIRKIVDNIKKPEMARPLIPLSLGMLYIWSSHGLLPAVKTKKFW